MIRHIPNLLTLLNLCMGFSGILLSSQGQHTTAVLLLFVALVCDFLDGSAARLLNARSPIGKELDSLADLVSFGVLPGVLVYALLGQLTWLPPAAQMGLAALSPAMAALRLARFNIDQAQQTRFSGLPSPAFAVWTAAFFMVNTHAWAGWLLAYQSAILVVWVLAAPLLMVLPLPMVALKFTKGGLADNWPRYATILLAIVLIAVGGWLGIILFVPAYLLLSLIYYGNKPQS